MANKKISDLLNLVAVDLNPASDLLEVLDVSAGANGNKKITIDALIEGWGMTQQGEDLSKASSLEEQRILLGINVIYNPTITGVIGGGPTKLDGIPTIGVVEGVLRLIYQDNVLKFYKLTASTTPEDGNIYIRPDDYNSPTNQKVWILQGSGSNLIKAEAINSKSLILTNSTTGGTVNFDIDLIGPGVVTYKLPEQDGTIALKQQMQEIVVNNTGSMAYIMFLPNIDLFCTITSNNGLPITSMILYPPAPYSVADGDVFTLHFVVAASGITTDWAPLTLTGTPFTSAEANSTHKFKYLNSGPERWIKIK